MMRNEVKSPPTLKLRRTGTVARNVRRGRPSKPRLGLAETGSPLRSKGGGGRKKILITGGAGFTPHHFLPRCSIGVRQVAGRAETCNLSVWRSYV